MLLKWFDPGSAAVMAADVSDGTTCTFTSRNYAVGDVWYPRLGQRGALHCVACICQEVKLVSNNAKLFIASLAAALIWFLLFFSSPNPQRAAKSTAPFTNAAARIAPRPSRPPPTNAASTVPVSLKEFLNAQSLHIIRRAERPIRQLYGNLE